MFQETKNIFNTANNTKSFQKNVFGVFKRGKKNDKSKCQLEGCNNKCSKKKFKHFRSDKSYVSKSLPLADEYLEESELNFSNLTKTFATSSTSISSTTPPLTVTWPVASTSVTSFFDDDSIDPELSAGSSSKSVSLWSYLPSNSSGLKLEVSTNDVELNDQEVVSSSNGQDNLEGSTGKKKKSNKKFKSIRKLRFFNNHPINSEQNDSAYETATEKDSQRKERRKKTKKTIMTPLSLDDKEYIEVKESFSHGLPNGNILGISRLQMPTKLVKAHEQYKKQVAQSNDLTESEVSHRMFHGTRSATTCDPQRLVGQKRPDFCKSSCGVCGIAKEGNKSKFSRYGHRMWFANSSATSQSYCSQNHYNGGAIVKVIFVVEVVATPYESILIVDKDAATIPKYFIAYI